MNTPTDLVEAAPQPSPPGGIPFGDAMKTGAFIEVLDSLTDIIMVLDKTGQLIFSSGGDGTLGFRDQYFDTAALAEAVHPDDRLDVYNRLMSMGRKEARTDRFDLRAFAKDGTTRVLEVNAHDLLADPSVHGIVLTVRDVTEIRQAADNLRHTIELQRAMLAMTSHDMRTPLAIMLAHLHLVEGDPLNQLSAETEISLKTIGRQGRYLDALLDDLVLLAEVEAGTFSITKRPFGPESIFSAIADDMAAHARDAAVEISTSLDATANLVADQKRVTQILHNLVCNALHLAPKVTQIDIRTWSAADGWHCSVTDDGPGIPESDQSRVFDRFYRGTDSGEREGWREGCGLGLSICDALVRAHGGAVWIESTGPRGTTIEFSLPNDPASHHV